MWIFIYLNLQIWFSQLLLSRVGRDYPSVCPLFCACWRVFLWVSYLSSVLVYPSGPCLSVCLSVVSLSARSPLSVWLSVCLAIILSNRPSVCASFCSPVCLSFWPAGPLFLYLHGLHVSLVCLAVYLFNVLYNSCPFVSDVCRFVFVCLSSIFFLSIRLQNVEYKTSACR